MWDDTEKLAYLLLTTGPMSDYPDAGHLCHSLPQAQDPTVDRGYDADCRCWIAA